MIYEKSIRKTSLRRKKKNCSETSRSIQTHSSPYKIESIHEISRIKKKPHIRPSNTAVSNIQSTNTTNHKTIETRITRGPT